MVGIFYLVKDRLNRRGEAIAGEYSFSVCVIVGDYEVGNLRTTLRNGRKAEQLKEDKADSGMETGSKKRKILRKRSSS